MTQPLPIQAEIGIVPAPDDTLAACHAPAALLDPEGRVVALSPAAVELMREIALEPAMARIAEAIATLAHPQGPADVSVTLPGADGAAKRCLELVLLPYDAADRSLLLMRDISLEHNLREALAESRQRFKDLVEASSDFAWEIGPDGAFAMVSAAGALGYEADELVGEAARGFVIDPPEDEPVLPFEAREPLEGYELWFRGASGEPACLIAACVPVFDEAGSWRGTRGVCQDVTEMRARESELAALRTRDRLMAYVVKTVSDVVDPAAMLEVAATATARVIDAAGCLIFRRRETLEEAARSGELPSDYTGHVADADVTDGPPGPGGSWLAMPTRLHGDVNGALCLWRPEAGEPWTVDERDFLADIAGHLAIVVQQVAQHDELERLSSTDALTGLDNRRAFFAALELRLGGGAGKRAGDDRPGSLVYLDLDNFKQVNDMCGHQRGDDALKAVAQILRQSSRAGDRVARLGGDEFALWLEATDAAGAQAKAETLQTASRVLSDFAPEGGKPLGLSVGIAVYDPSSGEDLESLIARADAVMYDVKHHGKGGFKIAPATPEPAS